MSHFPKNLLIIQAHPDDAEAWSAGTLSLLADRGWHITIATMTAGGLGSLDMDMQQAAQLRQTEASTAAAMIGADYHCLEQADGYVFDSQSIRVKTTALIRQVQAGVVITHLPFDYHQDHRTTCTIVDAAVMVATLPNVPCKEKPLSNTPLFYHNMPMNMTDTLGFPVPKPHFFVDISGKALEKKLNMLACHISQQRLMKHMMGMENFFDLINDFSAQVGQMAGLDYAECYWQHLGGGFAKVPAIQDELGTLIYERNMI